MRYTLMHISDLHAGPPFKRDIAAIVARHAHELQPDLLIISGDFVQRATFPWEWSSIKTYLHTLPEPRLVVPGNHDVPLFDGFSRLLAPMHYYRRHISRDLNPVFARPGLVVVGGNSAHGLTMDGGYVNRQQRAAIEQAFAPYPADTCKVAVLHHPLSDPPVGRHKSKIRNAKTMLQLLDRCGVDLFLCGHVHFSFVGTANGAATAIQAGTLITEREGIIICQSGTTTSRRGRGIDRGKNSFNVIEIDEQTIRIHPHFYEPAERRFLSTTEHVFVRGHGVAVQDR